MTKLIRYVLESTITKKSSAFAELSVRFEASASRKGALTFLLLRTLGFVLSHLSYEPLRTNSREFPFAYSASQQGRNTFFLLMQCCDL